MAAICLSAFRPPCILGKGLSPPPGYTPGTGQRSETKLYAFLMLRTYLGLWYLHRQGKASGILTLK